MDLLNLISNRKSVRKYLDKHIPDEDLRKRFVKVERTSWKSYC